MFDIVNFVGDIVTSIIFSKVDVSVIRYARKKDLTHLGPLQRASLNHYSTE